MPQQQTTSNRGRRAGLSRQRVVETAVELIDRDGLDTFSLRRLAAHIGVDPMSLYNHVANKDDLLDGVVEHVLAEVATATGARTGTWQDQVRQGAVAFRNVMLAHPQASIVVLTRRVLTDVPLRVLREGIRPLLQAGLPVDEAVLALRTFTAFLTGTILREVGSGMTFAAVDPERAAGRADDITRSGDPVLAEAARYIANIDHEAIFDYGVDRFIAGLASRIQDRETHRSRAPQE